MISITVIFYDLAGWWWWWWWLFCRGVWTGEVHLGEQLVSDRPVPRETHSHSLRYTTLFSLHIDLPINFPFVNFTECDPIFPTLRELKFLHYVAGAPLSLLDYWKSHHAWQYVVAAFFIPPVDVAYSVYLKTDN